jgi:hypothetical protein
LGQAWRYIPIILATWETEIRRIMVQDQHRQKQVIKKEKRAGGMGQMLEYLHTNHKTLSSNPSTAKKKEKEGGWYQWKGGEYKERVCGGGGECSGNITYSCMKTEK